MRTHPEFLENLILEAPSKATVARFRFLTRYSLSIKSPLHRIGITHSPDSALCVLGLPMTVEYLDVCSALTDFNRVVKTIGEHVH
ncbi:hypothetical protein TNCV_1956701 [Trichonephila clavipes]|nr:hypothetical protein TNCV_1956701 [Trichonephila clavipes]